MRYRNFLSAKFGRKNFDDSTCTRQIRQTFPPSKFYAIRYSLALRLFSCFDSECFHIHEYTLEMTGEQSGKCDTN